MCRIRTNHLRCCAVWITGLECKELMLLRQRSWPWGLSETMCGQSVTVGPSSPQRLFDVCEAFKFNPGESQGYTGFWSESGETLFRCSQQDVLHNNKMPACLKFKESLLSIGWRDSLKKSLCTAVKLMWRTYIWVIYLIQHSECLYQQQVTHWGQFR